MYRELWGNKAPANWIKMMIDNHGSPIAKFILYLLLNGRLPTKDRLLNFRLIDNHNWCLCAMDESIDHLFFSCVGLHSIWRNILLHMGIQRSLNNWNEEKKWMIRETKKNGWKTEILIIAIGETFYELSRSRNEKIFSQKDMEPILIENIIHNIVVRRSLHRDLNSHINASALCFDYESRLTWILSIGVYYLFDNEL